MRSPNQKIKKEFFEKIVIFGPFVTAESTVTVSAKLPMSVSKQANLGCSYVYKLRPENEVPDW